MYVFKDTHFPLNFHVNINMMSFLKLHFQYLNIMAQNNRKKDREKDTTESAKILLKLPL